MIFHNQSEKPCFGEKKHLYKKCHIFYVRYLKTPKSIFSNYLEKACFDGQLVTRILYK